MSEHFDRAETAKDTVQVAVESGATHVGSIVQIVTRAVRDVTHELGDWASDVFEMRDAARRAQADGRSGGEFADGDAQP
jgi:hypothetical protein